mgnify:CR=1 FL=1
MDEILGLGGYFFGKFQLWELGVFLAFMKDLYDVFIEGWWAEEELVGYDSKTPDIGLFSVDFLF